MAFHSELPSPCEYFQHHGTSTFVICYYMYCTFILLSSSGVFQIGEIHFKNYYTASVSLQAKLKGPTGAYSISM